MVQVSLSFSKEQHLTYRVVTVLEESCKLGTAFTKRTSSSRLNRYNHRITLNSHTTLSAFPADTHSPFTESEIGATPGV